MKKKEDRLEKQMAEVSGENKRLVEPLQKAKEDVAELQRQLVNYEKDKQLLAVSIETSPCISTTINEVSLEFSCALSVSSNFGTTSDCSCGTSPPNFRTDFCSTRLKAD